MKDFLVLLLFLAAGYWLYNRCTKEPDTDPDVQKQVRVTVATANLRTGPGTNFDVASVNADGTGGKWQVSRGTVLDVLGQKSGWYEVRLPKGERTAFIKQTLCADLSAKGRPSGTRSRRGGGSSSPSPSASSGTTPSAAEGTVSTAPAPGTSEEVVEEIVTNNSDDEVFF